MSAPRTDLGTDLGVKKVSFKKPHVHEVIKVKMEHATVMMDFVKELNTLKIEAQPALGTSESSPTTPIGPAGYPLKQRGGGRPRRSEEEGFKRKIIAVKMVGGIYQYKPEKGKAKDLQIKAFQKYLTEMMVDENNWAVKTSKDGFTHPLLGFFHFSISLERVNYVRVLVLGEKSTDPKGLSKFLSSIGMTSPPRKQNPECIEGFFNPSHWNQSAYKLIPGGHVGKGETAPLIIPLLSI